MKIIDSREIEFDAESVVKAISVSSKAAQAFGLPGMLPTGIRFHAGPGKVDVVYGTSQAPQAVSLPVEALGALLVSYCVRARIPMPRVSNKGVRIEQNSVILAFKTVYDKLPAPEMIEQVSRPAGAVAALKWLKPEVAPTH
jgi:hypothetical protein